jgi:hypothetical protein
MAERPGIMVYFDLLPQLQEYSKEEAGELFLAMLEYGAFGAVPAFEDRGLRIIWREVQGKIDRDNESYQRRVIDGAYGAYKRDLERKGDSPMPKDLWMAQIWIPSQKSTEVSGSMQKYTSGYMMSKNQQEQEQGTTTGTISGTGAGKGKGTGGKGSDFWTFGDDPDEFEKKRQSAIKRIQEGGF